VELPYLGDDVAFDVLLPADGKFTAFEQGLTAASLDALLGRMKDVRVALALPRFTTTTTLSLKETLQALGMADAFDCPPADFNGIEPGGQLYIAAALHQAYIRVDEVGTEAAAVTVFPIAPVGVEPPPPPPVPMIVDHPFLFLIRDLPTGQILFYGRIVDLRV
jgi:serpin B